MALDIQKQRIAGKIDNLQEKLNGELIINRVELLYLINSWGRTDWFFTIENIKINQCEAKECYDLSKLDTSEITDMSDLFTYSLFNGDISNWNTSNVTDMTFMFQEAEAFNQDINNWNVSSVTNMNRMFAGAWNFNQALNNWDVSKVTYMIEMFYNARAFKTKFNNGNALPNDTNNLKQWLNSDMMLAIEIKEREKDNLDSFYNNLESLYNNLDNKNLE